ncbi:MAG: endonuclease I, partial [Alcanivoracaceae bacterium]|nr:endonuclease I [Alcanivoracaceae bacterium]
MKTKVAIPKALLAVTLSVLSVTTMAQDAADVLINQVYAGGGSTLYCKEPFQPRDRGVKADSIYGGHLLLRHFSCITARQCSSKPGYDEVAGDLH